MKAMPRRGSSFSTNPFGSSFASVDSCPAAPRTQPSHHRRLGPVAVAVSCLTAAFGFLFVGLLSPAAAAESPKEVAEELAIDGVYVAPGRDDIDEDRLVSSLQEARARGLRLVVTAPNDPQPSASAFARRVLEASDADASIVFPIEGPPEIEVIDEFESASFRALDAARSKATPEAAVEVFAEELLSEPVRSVPPIVRQVVIVVVLLAVLLTGVVAIEQFSGRSKRGEAKERLTKVKS